MFSGTLKWWNNKSCIFYKKKVNIGIALTLKPIFPFNFSPKEYSSCTEIAPGCESKHNKWELSKDFPAKLEH